VPTKVDLRSFGISGLSDPFRSFSSFFWLIYLMSRIFAATSLEKSESGAKAVPKSDNLMYPPSEMRKLEGCIKEEIP
jgi:hypothetical protein